MTEVSVYEKETEPRTGRVRLCVYFGVPGGHTF